MEMKANASSQMDQSSFEALLEAFNKHNSMGNPEV
jgi:hypothetical protein